MVAFPSTCQDNSGPAELKAAEWGEYMISAMLSVCVLFLVHQESKFCG